MRQGWRLALAAVAALVLHLVFLLAPAPHRAVPLASVPAVQVEFARPPVAPKPAGPANETHKPPRPQIPAPQERAAHPANTVNAHNDQAVVAPAAPAKGIPNSPLPTPLLVQQAPATSPTPSGVSRPPVCLREPRPLMPALSRTLGETGKVILRLAIDESGQLKSVQWVSRSDYARLDDAALVAARQWRCQPALKNGQAHAAELDETVLFDLQ